ncbi:MAG TPA: sulfurtransferase [Thiotrichales bacterium]|nr:sulfurtransferase [Thiotrichales bacterium]
MQAKPFRIALLAVLIAGIALALIYRDRFDAAALESWVGGAGFAGPPVFMLLYALATVLFLPGSVLTLAGGALFGPVWGTLINLTGATVGAALAFLVARYLAADWVERKTGGRLRQLKEGVENEGWRFVAFVRLVPLFPFNLLNYALGLTRIRFLDYVIASWLFMLPGAVAYTYVGWVGREALAGEEGLIQKILLALALLAVVGFLPRFIAIVRRGPMLSVPALKERLDSGEELLILDVRSADDFNGEQGHIPGAVNIPLEELPAQLERLSDRLEKPVAIVCRTDRRSAKAAQILARNGFADVHVVKQGMTDWNAHGYPVE